MSVRRTNSGRKQSVERIREVVSVLGSLSETGDRISLQALAQRLGMSLDEASGIMSIVCQASGEEGHGLLISANDDMTEFTLEYPGIHGRAIRLTTPETIAIVHALDFAEVDANDPIREHLHAAFSSPDVNDDEVRKALGSSLAPETCQALRLCAKSQAEHRMLTFMYKGLADDEAKERCVLVRRLRVDQSLWYADAYDLDHLQDRTFRLDRMSSVVVGTHGRLPDDEDSAAPEAQWVDVVFSDPYYVTLFDWPGLRITSRIRNTVRGTIPYYGDRSDWLIRRILACDGTLQTKDERIMQRVTQYARSIANTF